MIWSPQASSIPQTHHIFIVMRVAVFPLHGIPFLTCPRGILLKSRVVVVVRGLPEEEMKRRPVFHMIQTIQTLGKHLRWLPLSAATSLNFLKES